MTSQVHHLKEMTWQDVESLDRENTVVMFACGPIEQHGPQAPLSTDLYIAEHVMHRCAGSIVRSPASIGARRAFWRRAIRAWTRATASRVPGARTCLRRTHRVLAIPAEP